MPQYEISENKEKTMDQHVHKYYPKHIDYVFINEKCNNSVLNYEAYSSLESVSSDHRIVTAKIRQGQRMNAFRTTTVHYAWSLIKNRDIRDKYALTLRNTFDERWKISEILTPNDKFENFVNAHGEVAA